MQNDGERRDRRTIEDFYPLAQARVKATTQKLSPLAQQMVALDKAVIQGMRADQIISLFKLAIVRRQFPAQFLLKTFEEIQAAARANEPGARKALKLLLNRRFDK